MVSVRKSDTNNRISVKSTKETNVFTIKDNLSEYYAKQAENWAHSEGMVNGIDYSSKYYAEQSKASAKIASDVKAEAQNLTQGFDNKVLVAKNNIEQTRIDSIDAINSVYTFVAEEMRNKSEQAFRDIDIKSSEVLGNLEQTIDTSIAEYTEISNQIKQDNSESSKLAQDWATSEVLVDNIDYSAKYYAEKAKDNSGIFYEELTDKNIDVEILDVNYATKSELELGLDTKQDKGDYALVEDIPTQVSELENDSNYATQTQVMQAIASIPQFSLSIVEALPTTGEKMTLYLVPKEGANNDVYDEYIWIEQTSSFEHLGTTAVDLSEYVKNTDYATSSTAGVIKAYDSNAFDVSTSGNPICKVRSLDVYNKQATPMFISKGTLENIKDDYIKRGITDNQIELTEDEKTNARTWLGAVGSSDYGTDSKVGLVKGNSTYGITVFSGGLLVIQGAGENDIKGKGNQFRPITPKTMDFALKNSITTNTIELSEDEKASARTWIGAVGKTDYATPLQAGLIKALGDYNLTVTSTDGTVLCNAVDLTQYKSSSNYSFISKGTLENIKNDLVKRSIDEDGITLTNSTLTINGIELTGEKLSKLLALIEE